jgi:hypothetical protein
MEEQQIRKPTAKIKKIKGKGEMGVKRKGISREQSNPCCVTPSDQS